MTLPPHPETVRPDRKQEILQAALHCFLKRGVEATSIDDIRLQCNASVGSIYHHFGNKEGIAAALFLKATSDHSQRLLANLAAAESAEAGIRSIVGNYIDWVGEHPDLARFLFLARTAISRSEHGERLDKARQDHFAEIFRWFDGCLARGELRVLPREVYPALILGPTQDYCRAWLAGRVKAPPQAYRGIFEEEAWRAVQAR